MTAARQARCSYNWCKGSPPTHLSYKSCKTTTRSTCTLLQGCRKNAAKRTTVLLCLANFAWPFCVSLSCKRKIIVQTSYYCRTFCVTAFKIGSNLPHCLYVLLPAAKSHEQTAVWLMWNMLNWWQSKQVLSIFSLFSDIKTSAVITRVWTKNLYIPYGVHLMWKPAFSIGKI